MNSHLFGGYSLQPKSLSNIAFNGSQFYAGFPPEWIIPSLPFGHWMPKICFFLCFERTKYIPCTYAHLLLN